MIRNQNIFYHTEGNDTMARYLSEKMLYGERVREQFRNMFLNTVLWGEDLYNAKIIVYPDRITDLPDYEKYQNDLSTAGLVLVNTESKNVMKCVQARWDRQERKLFLCEDTFNAVWKKLRDSVAIGINNLDRHHSGEVDEPEDIVDLSYLSSRRGRAVIQSGKIEYIPYMMPQEEQRLISKKQSMLDDPNNRFFYSSNEFVYHDKDCELTARIHYAVFEGSYYKPLGYGPCERCRRKMVVREMCRPYAKQMGIVNYILTKNNVDVKVLDRLAFKEDIKLRSNDKDEMTVISKADTWIIRGLDNGDLALWHNNYIMLPDKERHITMGFHKQKFQSNDLTTLLKYIDGYDYKWHIRDETETDEEATEQTDRLIESRELCVE